MSKNRDHYTIMIIPHSERDTVTLRIPVFIVQLLVVFIVVCILVSMVWVNRYFYMVENYDQAKSARIEVEMMQKEYSKVVGQVLTMEEQMLKIQALEQQLRLEHGFDPAESYVEQSNLLDTVHHLSRERKSGVTASSILVEETQNEVDYLMSGIPVQAESLELLLSDIQKKNKALAHTPDIWPSVGRFTSKFGYRRDPFTNKRKLHSGIDIANRVNTPVYATANGVVTFSGWHTGYGRKININHQNGLSTLYAHLNKIIIHEGEEVKKGQLIGYMGNSGRSTGTHLHYEIHLNGKPVDPMKYIER